VIGARLIDWDKKIRLEWYSIQYKCYLRTLVRVLVQVMANYTLLVHSTSDYVGVVDLLVLSAVLVRTRVLL
jgi:hypothetical protein